MSRKARMRAAAASAVALAIGLAFSTGLVHGVWANFQSETQNSNSAFAGDYVDAPTSLNSPSASGLGASLTWVAGTHNVSNQDIYFYDNTSTTNCTGVTYSSLQTGVGATRTAISGTGSPNDAMVSGDNGDNICYQVRSTNTSGWYTIANFSVVQVGLVPTSISYDGVSHLITNGTHITINYNQNMSFSTANTRVCIFSNGTILLGDTTGACGSSGDTTVFGSITGETANKSLACTTSSFGGSGTTQLTVTINGCPTTGNPKAPVTMGGTGTFNPSGSTMTSSTGGVSQCTNAGAPTSGCKPTIGF